MAKLGQVSLTFDIFDNICLVKCQTSKSFDKYNKGPFDSSESETFVDFREKISFFIGPHK